MRRMYALRQQRPHRRVHKEMCAALKVSIEGHGKNWRIKNASM